MSEREVVAAHLAEDSFVQVVLAILFRRAMPTNAKMDLANRAMCYALRNPPKGVKVTKCEDIRDYVRKTDGTKPTVGAA